VHDRVIPTAQLREQLAEALGEPVPDWLWASLRREHIDYDNEMNKVRFDYVVRTARIALRAAASGAPRMLPRDRLGDGEPGEGGGAPEASVRALSLLVANQARTDDEVLAFRSDVLHDELLALEQVYQWVQRQSRLQGNQAPFCLWLPEVQVPSAEVRRVLQSGLRRPEEAVEPVRITIPVEQLMWKGDPHYLEYVGVAPTDIPVPYEQLTEPVTLDDRQVRHLRGQEAADPMRGKGAAIFREPVVPSSELDRLRHVSQRLARRHGWTAAQAATFVLTDAVPAMPAVTHTFEWRLVPEVPRIVLTIEPSVSPREVTDYYRRVRREVAATRTRPRQYGEKHLRLANFVAGRPAGERWRATMDAWNAQVPAAVPKWRYKEPSNFQRDAQRAQRWLLRARAQDKQDNREP
jgi:hypothetical protein